MVRDAEVDTGTVTDFLDSIGYDAHDAGPLAEGWRYQRDTAAYVTPYAEPGAEDFATGTRRATAADLERALTYAGTRSTARTLSATSAWDSRRRRSVRRT